MPRPPETTIAASVSSGRPEAWRGCEATILAFLAASEIVGANSSTAPAPAVSSGVAELGLTVMIGVPWVTLAWTVKLPAKTLWVVTGPVVGCTSTASVIRPDSILIARRAAISLPSEVEGIEHGGRRGLLDQLLQRLGLGGHQVALDLGCRRRRRSSRRRTP